MSHSLDSVPDDGLRDIQGFHALELPQWLVVSFWLILAALLIWFIYTKFICKEEDLSLTVFELAVKKLHDLDLNLNSKRFYLEYSEYIRIYLEERLGIAALDKTAEEISPMLISEHKIQTSNAMMLSKIFARADLAKFAKMDVPVETKSKDVETTIQILGSIEDAIRLEEERRKEAELRDLDLSQSETEEEAKL